MKGRYRRVCGVIVTRVAYLGANFCGEYTLHMGRLATNQNGLCVQHNY
jgi:hypothetical protein